MELSHTKRRYGRTGYQWLLFDNVKTTRCMQIKDIIWQENIYIKTSKCTASQYFTSHTVQGTRHHIVLPSQLSSLHHTNTSSWPLLARLNM
jgi:hypothetical protein